MDLVRGQGGGPALLASFGLSKTDATGTKLYLESDWKGHWARRTSVQVALQRYWARDRTGEDCDRWGSLKRVGRGVRRTCWWLSVLAAQQALA